MTRQCPTFWCRLHIRSAARERVRRPGEAAPAPRALSVFSSKTNHLKTNHLNRWGGRLARLPQRALGFSLMEVMLAVVILGLGILGLSALFAGAAKQQQTSTQVVRSVEVAQNVKATLNRKLGTIEGVGAALPDGQWAWIKSLNPTNTTLTVTTIDPKAFFRVQSTAITLFTGSPLDPSAPNASSYIDGGNSPFFGGNVNPFPHRQIIPSTLTIRVSVNSTTGIPGADETFDFVPTTTPADDQFTDLITYEHTPPSGVGTASRIQLSLAPGSQTSTTKAFIQSFNLAGVFTESGFATNPYITKIEALPYAWKSTELLSLNERLSYVDDGRFPPLGLRPEVGYVLFFRQFGQINQAMVVTYALQPQSRPRLNNTQFPLIPPDDDQTFASNNGVDSLVRETQVEIGWDNLRQQYFVQADVTTSPDTDESWVAKPGQLLLMSSQNGFGSSSGLPGADTVVRVISQSPDPDNDMLLRGYLDDAPRVDLGAVTPQSPTAVPQTIYVWALAPEITNADTADSNKTRWKIRPIDARLIPIATQ